MYSQLTFYWNLKKSVINFTPLIGTLNRLFIDYESKSSGLRSLTCSIMIIVSLTFCNRICLQTTKECNFFYICPACNQKIFSISLCSLYEYIPFDTKVLNFTQAHQRSEIPQEAMFPRHLRIVG